MTRTFMISKLHNAVVTQRDLHYSGSITIDKDLLDVSGMQANEKVDIYNIDNSNRFSTYIIEGEAGSGIIGVNGAAARLVSIDDRVIIVNYGQLDETEMKNHKSKVIIVKSSDNKEFIIKKGKY
ncbi:MAG: aspartate 1-decarboxylase [Candidatus Cloacimonadota bacterium]|nr:aspartate 1-decarboxylase [Candidatus Cloacimonadota bacterium]